MKTMELNGAILENVNGGYGPHINNRKPVWFCYDCHFATYDESKIQEHIDQGHGIRKRLV